MVFVEQALLPLDLLGCSRWSREDLERFQSRRLARLVRHASERVPFYRDLYREHGIKPEDVRGLGDLPRLPVVGRDQMQLRPPGDLVASGYNPQRLIEWRTSGSTGAPFTIRRTWLEDRLLNLLRIRQQRLRGLTWSDVRTSSAIGELRRGPQAGGPIPGLRLLRRLPVNILAEAREILTRLAEIQPDVIVMYPGTLAWIAAEATPEDRDKIRPRVIFTGGEVLTPAMRRQIAECFRAPVFDFYGAHEFNLVSSECALTGLHHIEETGLIVEVLNNGRPCAEGESGEICGTALHSFAMPFLRYRLGDVVVRGPARCPCGAPNSTLLRIEGRTVDRFPLPHGGSLHPYDLVVPLTCKVHWVRRYQIVQETLNRIRVRVVPMPSQKIDQDEKEMLKRLLESVVGTGVEVALDLVEEIRPNASGKLRSYYSELPNTAKNRSVV